MSIFINARGQLQDKDFFGKELSYKIPKSIPLNEKNKKAFKLAHSQIKTLLFNELEKPSAKELKEIVSTYFQSSPNQQQKILGEGIKAKTVKIVEPNLAHLFSIYRDYVEEYKTIKTKGQVLARIDTWLLFLNSKGMNDTTRSIDRQYINNFVNWRYEFRKPNCSRKGEVSDTVVNKETNELKKCLEWNFSEGNIPSLPRVLQIPLELPLRKNRKPIAPLTLEEQVSLLETLEKEDPYYHDSFLLLLICGLRAGELDNLSPSSFNLKQGTLQIHDLSVANSIEGGKTDSAPRVLPLNPTLIKLYHRGNIFPTHFTHKIGKSTYKRVIKGTRRDRIHSFISRRKSQGKISHEFHLHRLRHTFVTNNLQVNRRDLEVSRWAGHKSITITLDRYGKYLSLGIQKLVQAYEEHLNWLEQDYFK